MRTPSSEARGAECGGSLVDFICSGDSRNLAWMRWPTPQTLAKGEGLRFPLESSGTGTRVDGFSIMIGTSATLPSLWLDEVEFLER